MVVDVEAPGFGFVEIEMLAVGDQAYIKLSKTLRGTPCPSTRCLSISRGWA